MPFALMCQSHIALASLLAVVRPDARFTHVVALSFLSSSAPPKVFTRKKSPDHPLRRENQSAGKTAAPERYLRVPPESLSRSPIRGLCFDRFEQQTPDASSAAAGGNGQIVNVDQRFAGERGKTSHPNRDPYRAAVQPREKPASRVSP